jgi:hypothetical protein
VHSIFRASVSSLKSNECFHLCGGGIRGITHPDSVFIRIRSVVLAASIVLDAGHVRMLSAVASFVLTFSRIVPSRVVPGREL